MKSSIVLRSLNADPLEKLSAISKAGFNGVELAEEDYVTFDGTPADMGRALTDHGLRADLFRHPFALTGHTDPRWVDRAERSFDLMEDLGTDLLLMALDASASAPDALRSASTELHRLAERAAARGFRVGLETVGPGLRDYGDFIASAGADNLGLILDSLQCLSGATSPDTAKDLDGAHIFHVRFSDAPDISVSTPILTKIFRTMPGEGDLPLAAFASAVASTGYAGPYGVDVPPHRPSAKVTSGSPPSTPIAH